jgi:hypothetical protein
MECIARLFESLNKLELLPITVCYFYIWAPVNSIFWGIGGYLAKWPPSCIAGLLKISPAEFPRKVSWWNTLLIKARYGPPSHTHVMLDALSSFLAQLNRLKSSYKHGYSTRKSSQTI